MPATEILGYGEAVSALSRNLSPRARELRTLEAYVDGTQYAGLEPWEADAPMLTRAPCIVYPIVKMAIDSNVDLLLGEGRRPVVTTRPSEDDTALGVDGLGTDDSETVDRYMASAHRESRFWTVARTAFALGQGARSSATVWCARNGRLAAEVLRARWCEPQFDVHGENVAQLVVSYPYIDTERQADGSYLARAKLYRRVIDETSDTTYLPLLADPNGRPPQLAAWSPDPARSVKHGLGFCPVVWYAHMRGPVSEATFDGNAVHELLEDEIRAHDYALSMRHSAALYAGEPQWTEIGVEQGSNPSTPADGNAGIAVHASRLGGPASASNPMTGTFRSPSRMTGRKKGARHVWQYENDNAKVTLHTLPGEALKALDEHARDVRQKLCECLAVVFLDPENIKFAATLSGKALESVKRRQLDRMDIYRDDFGDGWIKPSGAMVLRISAVLGESLRTPGIKKALPVLRRIAAEAQKFNEAVPA